MRKFWLSGSVEMNSVTARDVEEMTESQEVGGIVNNAFDENEFNTSFSNLKNLGVIKELEENMTGINTKKVDTKKTGDSQDSGLDSCSKQYSVTDSEDTATDSYSEVEFDLMRRPTRSISRMTMIQKLADEQGKLGTMCQEADCPYNKWLYRGHKFPEDQTVKDWEIKDKTKKNDEKFPLENFSLPRVILSKHSQPRRSTTPSSPGHKSHRSSSFHYSKSPYPFAFPNPTSTIYLPNTFTPPGSSGPSSPSTAPLPSYPWHLYNSPPSNLSISSSYPIVTLPRSIRKSSKKSTPRSSSSSQSYLSNLCHKKRSKPKTPPVPIFYMKPKFSAPPSPSSSSSCSCTSSSCSSCNSSIDIPMDPRSPYAFTQDTHYRPAPGKTHPCMPRCDATCYVITSFILVSMAGLAALLLYLYLFTPVMEDTGEM